MAKEILDLPDYSFSAEVQQHLLFALLAKLIGACQPCVIGGRFIHLKKIEYELNHVGVWIGNQSGMVPITDGNHRNFQAVVGPRRYRDALCGLSVGTDR